jgi:hypothetical protein
MEPAPSGQMSIVAAPRRSPDMFADTLLGAVTRVRVTLARN